MLTCTTIQLLFLFTYILAVKSNLILEFISSGDVSTQTYNTGDSVVTEKKRRTKVEQPWMIHTKNASLNNATVSHEFKREDQVYTGTDLVIWKQHNVSTSQAPYDVHEKSTETTNFSTSDNIYESNFETETPNLETDELSTEVDFKGRNNSIVEEEDKTDDDCIEICIKSRTICAKDKQLYGSCLVSVCTKGEPTPSCTCSGVVIKSCCVLTPAHCVDCRNLEKCSQFYVKSSDQALHEVADVTFYPQTRGMGYHDLAILKLEKEFEVVDLDKNPALIGKKSPADGDVCSFVHWDENEKIAMRQATVKHTDCKPLKEVLPDSKLLCATGQDKCVLNPGTPMLCEDNLVGIVTSADAGECKGIFTDVTAYSGWIHENTPNRIPLCASNINVNHLCIILGKLLVYFVNQIF